MPHTPKPWKVKWWEPKYAINAGNRHIAMVSCYQKTHNDEPENVANAKLIAAAPELLEACQAQRHLIEDMMRFVGTMALQDYALLNEAPIMADKAIARAT